MAFGEASRVKTAAYIYVYIYVQENHALQKKIRILNNCVCGRYGI